MKLKEGIDEFLRHKRASGATYRKAEVRLRMLLRSLGNRELSDLKADDVATYLDRLPRRSSESVSKYLQIDRFLQFLQIRGEIEPLALPPKPIRVSQEFIPYVFTNDEVRRLLAHVRMSQLDARCILDAEVFRMLLILLYATGATVSEVLLLRRSSINLPARTITLYNVGRARDRTIYIGDSLRIVLGQFVHGRFPAAKSVMPLLHDEFGRALTLQLVLVNFKRLCRIADIRRRDGSHSSPRLQDLKVTFAANRIRDWIAHGHSMNRMLPALAAYMGQSGLGATHAYFKLVPERFAKTLEILSPGTRKVSWLDDPAAMRLIDNLSR